MKICIFSDVHWSRTSSICNKNGDKYSVRLEYLVNSMNWVNDIATNKQCDVMICAGDFFDKSIITDEEMTSLRDIKWNNLPCYFLCGNHESSVCDLRYNALKALESQNHFIISEQDYSIKDNKTQINFVPYITETERQCLENYINKDVDCVKQIIISHNDIAGINYGGFTSKSGFSITEIENNCDLYLNGHLHNSEWVSKKILNVGSLSAHNFTNDSSKYSYGIWILNTDTSELEFVENPYSLNFYKFDLGDEKNIDTYVKTLDICKENAIITIKVNACVNDEIRKLLLQYINIIESKVLIQNDKIVNNTISELYHTNHIDEFKAYILNNIDNTKLLLEEIQEICK